MVSADFFIVVPSNEETPSVWVASMHYFLTPVFISLLDLIVQFNKATLNCLIEIKVPPCIL